jgi:CBS domain-containing protein
MSVGEICNRDVVIATRDTSIPELARLMREHHVGSIVVVEDRGKPSKPLGIVTDRDLVVEVLATDVDMEQVAAGDVMGPELLTARETDGIWETIMRMRAMGVRRLPVVDAERHHLVGILTMDDLLEFVADELSDLVRLVRREQRREQETRT